MKKLALLLLFACPMWAQNWPSFRGDNASGIGGKEKIPANWNIEKSTNILWKTSIPGLAHSSPIIWDQQIFVTTAIASDQNRELRIGGVSPMDMPDDMSRQSYRIYCVDLTTGELIYQNRLGKGGFFSASPVAADGKIYAVSEEGDVFVVKAGSAFELLATNAMNEVCMATPAISRGKIVIRTLSKLVGIGIP